jgi:flagella basal body P-ring formation protein FlgA
MSFRFLMAIFALLLLAVSPFDVSFGTEQEHPALIQLKSVVEVDGSRSDITLGDVMVARDVSSDAMESLKDVRLADTPRPGESRSFSAVGLEQIFRPHLRSIEEKSGEKINLRVPARVTIVRKSLKLRKEDVETELKSQFKSICGDCEIIISSLSLPAVPPTVTAGAIWKIQSRPELPKGSFSLPLEVTYEDGTRRTYWISGSLAVRKSVPVASRSLMAGERLMPQDFNQQMKDVTFATDIAAPEAEIMASVAARGIAAGDIVWRGSLRREMAIRSGDTVKVTSGGEAWIVTVEGVAQTSGYIGDVVRVKIPRTQKIVSGMLKEKGLVEVR